MTSDTDSDSHQTCIYYLFYFMFFTEKCSCANGARCNHITGDCTCKAGWYGDNCKQPCELDHWGQGCQVCSTSQSLIKDLIMCLR